VNRYTQADPIAQNLAHARLHAKLFLEGNTETLPGHVAELQRLREACGGLGVTVTDSQFVGIIMLSMPTLSWDPVIGTLGGVLDPRVILSCLNMEWSWCQGAMTNNKDVNVVFQASSKMYQKCENCNRTGHTKVKCWAKGGRLEGQYPEWFKGKRNSRTSNTVNTVTETPIVWAYRSTSLPDIWIADSATTVHVSSNRNDFSTYRKYEESCDIKAFRNNLVKGVEEGDIIAEVEFKEKPRKFVSHKSCTYLERTEKYCL